MMSNWTRLFLACIYQLQLTFATNTTAIEDTGAVGERVCRLVTENDDMDKRVSEILEQNAKNLKIIEYRFHVRNYTQNPLLSGSNLTYQGNIWTHVGSPQGFTILNLAFNYGVLSLMTLSLGVVKMDVDLEDEPQGCVGQLSGDQKTDAVLQLVLRMFNAENEIALLEKQPTVCYKVLQRSAAAKIDFVDRCCHYVRQANNIECSVSNHNRWLNILEILLVALHLIAFMYGPAFLPGWMYTAMLDVMDYVVLLKEPIYKTMCISRLQSVQADVQARHVIDLRDQNEFYRCRRRLRELPSGMILPIKISRYDLRVSCKKLLTENHAPISISEYVVKALFKCKIRELESFRDCCDANVYGNAKCVRRRPWIDLCESVGRILLILLLPTPFYMRLLIYYKFEHPEISMRHAAASRVDLPMDFHFNLMQYLTPTHFVYILAFVITACAATKFAYVSDNEHKTRLQHVVISAFKDMRDLSMLKAFSVVISNAIWPFKRFGILGIFVGLVYWPIVIPLSVLMCVVHCLPIVFLVYRIIRHTFGTTVTKRYFSELKMFETDAMLGAMHINRGSIVQGCQGNRWTLRPLRVAANLGISIVTSLMLLSVMLLASEVIIYVAETVCYTLMGLIVNAAHVFKYGSLLFLVLIYSYDCYNNVSKKYIKLNKALFSEIKARLGIAIDEFTSLPTTLQANRGFKACEVSEQADYENKDDLAITNSNNWIINDLILFVDYDDTPRIPKQLFDEVCRIRVLGSPGPLNRNLLNATGKFLIIACFLVFLFLVVLAFADKYEISSTNQILATMAGGFMPLVLSKALRPNEPEVATKSVSFQNKLEEIITNFYQTWPMNDLLFEIEKEPSYEASGHATIGFTTDDSATEIKPFEEKDNIGTTDGSRMQNITELTGSTTVRAELNERELNLDPLTGLEMLNLEPAEGRSVDILIYVSEDDYLWEPNDVV